MSIRDIEKEEQRTEHEPGSISYVIPNGKGGGGNRPPRDPRYEDEYYEDEQRPVRRVRRAAPRKGFNLFGRELDLVPILLSGLIGIIGALIIILAVAPSKDDVNYLNSRSNDLEKSIQSNTNKINDASSITAEFSTRVDNIANTMGTYVKKTELGSLVQNNGDFATKSDLKSYATKSDLNSVSVDKAVSDKVTALEGQVTSLSEGLAAASKKVTELEASIASSSSSSSSNSSSSSGTQQTTGAVAANFMYGNNMAIFDAGKTTMDFPLFVTLTNGYNVPIKNVEVQVLIHSRGVRLDLKPGLCVVEGGWPLVWETVYVSNGIYIAQGRAPTMWDSLMLSANESKYLSATVGLGVPNALTEDVVLYAEVKVTGFTKLTN